MNTIQVVASISPAGGGAAISTLGLSKELNRRNLPTRVFTTDAAGPIQTDKGRRSLENFAPEPGFEHLDIRLFPCQAPRRLAYSPQLLRAMINERYNIDLIHNHGLYLYPQFAVWQVARRGQLPLVVSPRGVLDPYIRNHGRLRKLAFDYSWQRRMLNSSSIIHATSETERDWIQDFGISSPVWVIPNGIDLELFSSRNDKEEVTDFEDSSRPPILLNHGRITHKKGLEIAVEALAIIHRSFPGTKLVLVGPDDEGLGMKLITRAAELGVSNSLELVGPLSGSELAARVRESDVWLLPSRGENFGNAVIEALAAGRPVVTSPHVGVAAHASLEKALVVCKNDPDSLALHILCLLERPTLRRELSQRAVSYASMFDWCNLGARYEDMYREAFTIAKSTYRKSLHEYT